MHAVPVKNHHVMNSHYADGAQRFGKLDIHINNDGVIMSIKEEISTHARQN